MERSLSVCKESLPSLYIHATYMHREREREGQLEEGETSLLLLYYIILNFLF